MKASDRVHLCKELITQQRSRREICHLLKMSPKTVAAIRNDTVDPESRPQGRPKAVKQEMLAYMDEVWSVNALVSDQEMTDMVNTRFGTNVSRTTIMRRRKELRYEYRPPKVQQMLTPEQKRVRVEFCRYILEKVEQFQVILFTDESRFCKGPDNQWRQMKRGTYNETCFAEQSKFSQGVMVWGGIALGYRTNLMPCSGHVDTHEYSKVLEESNFITDMNNLHGRGAWVFMQDGAPCHTASATLEFLTGKGVLVLPGWPANSPDLNPIEMLWGILKRRVRRDPDLNATSLVAKLTEAWRAIDRTVIDSLCQSFVRRCELVLRLDGSSATPYLQAHRLGQPTAMDLRREWTDEDDQTIVALVSEIGMRWSIIAQRLGERPNFVKYRYNRARQNARNLELSTPHPLPSITDFPEPTPDLFRGFDCDELFQDPMFKIGNQI